MRNILFYLSILFIIISCNSDKEEEKILLKQQAIRTKMINLLMDIQLMESTITVHRKLNKKSNQDLLYQEILNKHNISKAEFDSNMVYLEKNIELYKQVLDSVLIKIENLDTIILPLIKEIDTTKHVKTKRRKTNKK